MARSVCRSFLPSATCVVVGNVLQRRLGWQHLCVRRDLHLPTPQSSKILMGANSPREGFTSSARRVTCGSNPRVSKPQRSGGAIMGHRFVLPDSECRRWRWPGRRRRPNGREHTRSVAKVLRLLISPLRDNCKASSYGRFYESKVHMAMLERWGVMQFFARLCSTLDGCGTSAIEELDRPRTFFKFGRHN